MSYNQISLSISTEPKSIKILDQIENDHEIKSLFLSLDQDGHPPNFVSKKDLAKLLTIGFIYNFQSLWEVENEVRISPQLRALAGFDRDKNIPSYVEIIYSKLYYDHHDIFFSSTIVEILNRIEKIDKNRHYPDVNIFLEKIIAESCLNPNSYNQYPPFMYESIIDKKKCKKCTNGCVFYLDTENKNLDDLTENNTYRCGLKLKGSFQAATCVTGTSEKPHFPLGKVFGKFERLPLSKDDCDGGLRTRGIYKKNSPQMPLITYITVVYNKCDDILACMESVWAQSYSNIEYIVVDGGSTDGTLEMIESHADKIDYFVSQPDAGIYNAMNKGISLASGQFLCFMNSDDRCAINAAQDIVNCYLETQADVICGWINIRRVDGTIHNLSKERPRYLIPHNVIRYCLLYHQALYGSCQAYETIGYLDESYTIPADNKWTVLCIDNGLKIELIQTVVATFSLGGNSDQQRKASEVEHCRLWREFFPFLSPKDAEICFYSLRRTPSLTRELDPFIRKIQKYFPDLEFRRTIYQISLYMCIEELFNILLYIRQDNSATQAIISAINQKDLNIVREVHTGRNVLTQLQDVLKKNLANDSQDITDNDFKELCQIKSFCNEYYRRGLLSNEQRVLRKLKMKIKQSTAKIASHSNSLTIMWMKRQYLNSK